MRRTLPMLLVLAACGTLGSEELEDLPQPHGGVGPFRPLETSETGVAAGPTGRAIALRQAFDNGMVTESGRLFYAAADPMDGVVQPDDVPPTEVAWDLMEPRRIYRSEPGDELAGFPPGSEILAATEAWEGEEITDPWAVATPEGDAVHLYYVGDGGVGVAMASSVDGAFTRVAGPILEPEGGETLRRPSVVFHDGRWLMYFDRGEGRIGVAESTDGVSFTRIVDALDIAEPEGAAAALELEPETGVGMPGAVAVTTPGGRRVVRVYFESIRADGSRWISLAASLDGVSGFDRLERPVVEEENRGQPAPFVVDDRTTLLYYGAPRPSSDPQLRTLVAAIAPRSVQLGAQTAGE